jgi:hypothetical protein
MQNDKNIKIKTSAAPLFLQKQRSWLEKRSPLRFTSEQFFSVKRDP